MELTLAAYLPQSQYFLQLLNICVTAQVDAFFDDKCSRRNDSLWHFCADVMK